MTNPFAGPVLWQAYRFIGYFQRQTVAVFTELSEAENFCLARVGEGNGYYVGSYRRPA